MREGQHLRYGLKFAKNGGDIIIERLKEIVSYDPETGIFRWKVSTARRIKVGDIAGSITSHGYRIIRIDRLAHYAHRLAWFYVHGEYPERIDHVDRDRDHNWIANLREATHRENLWNTKKSKRGNNPFKGVWWSATSKSWTAMATIDGRRKWLGGFKDPKDAALAYDAAVREVRGAHARYNFPKEGEQVA